MEVVRQERSAGPGGRPRPGGGRARRGRGVAEEAGDASGPRGSGRTAGAKRSTEVGFVGEFLGSSAVELNRER